MSTVKGVGCPQSIERVTEKSLHLIVQEILHNSYVGELVNQYSVGNSRITFYPWIMSPGMSAL